MAGHADIGWRLDSTAFRRLLKSGDISTPVAKTAIHLIDQEISSYEEYLLRRATHHRFRYFEGRQLSDFELLARLRHYGAATRLLDASRNALVALWFAVSSLPETSGALFGIHCWTIGGDEAGDDDTTYPAIVQELLEMQHPITWSPVGLTPRTAAQHSQFLLSAIGADTRGSIRIASDKYALLVICIPARLKRELATILKESFDIHYYSSCFLM